MKKRLFDISVASVGLLVMAVPMLTLFAVSRLYNGGKGYFLHERVGKDLETFKVFKIQSLKEEFNGQSSHLTTENHVTPFFDFVRRRGLDEIPQLINVLTGKMSAVGPRPLPPNEFEALHAPLETYSVRPGLTSPYTVWSLQSGCKDDRVKKEMDLKYAQSKPSIRRDVLILANTFLPAVLGKSPQSYDSKARDEKETPKEACEVG